MHKVGDIVVLNSGGPYMTVVNVQESIVTCAWYLGSVNQCSVPREGLNYASMTVPALCLTLIRFNPNTVN